MVSFGGGPKIGQGVGFKGGPKFGKPANPLDDVEYVDDLAEDCASEFDALEQAYRDRAKAEEQRKVAATDSEFWFAVCFSSRDEKDAFLAEFGLGRIGDKYLDGAAVARLLRKKLKE